MPKQRSKTKKRQQDAAKDCGARLGQSQLAINGWNIKFARLEAYYAKHGHIDCIYRTDLSLAAWISDQKKRVRNKKLRPGDEQYTRLERFGVWSLQGSIIAPRKTVSKSAVVAKVQSVLPARPMTTVPAARVPSAPKIRHARRAATKARAAAGVSIVPHLDVDDFPVPNSSFAYPSVASAMAAANAAAAIAAAAASGDAVDNLDGNSGKGADQDFMTTSQPISSCTIM